MRVHHINSWKTYEEGRLDPSNGILLCPNHHDLGYPDGFHSIYGTHGDYGSEQLEEYINNKRKELGINIPFSIDKYRNGEILTKDMVNNYYEDAWDLSIGRKMINNYIKPNEKHDNKFLMMKPKYRIKEECNYG